jgi:hypothetical protein
MMVAYFFLRLFYFHFQEPAGDVFDLCKKTFWVLYDALQDFVKTLNVATWNSFVTEVEGIGGRKMSSKEFLGTDSMEDVIKELTSLKNLDIFFNAWKRPMFETENEEMIGMKEQEERRGRKDLDVKGNIFF